MRLALIKIDDDGILAPVGKVSIEWVKKLALSTKIFVEYEDGEKHSKRQRKLYRMWIGDISKESGYTKEELVYEYKNRFLKPIYERDKAEYREMFEAVRKVYRAGDKVMAQSMVKFIVDKMSTLEATVKQMTEYLKQIDHEAATKHHLNLRRPKDKWIEQQFSR